METIPKARWFGRHSEQTVAARERPEVTPSPHRKRATVSTGDVVCRAYGETGQDVNYYTCTEMAKFWWIDVDFFFTLNPTLNKDCGNIQPNTQYCTDGCQSTSRSCFSSSNNGLTDD